MSDVQRVIAKETISSFQELLQSLGVGWKAKSEHDGGLNVMTPAGRFMAEWAVFHVDTFHAQVMAWVPHDDGEHYRLRAQALAPQSLFPWRLEWDEPPSNNALYQVVLESPTIFNSLMTADHKRVWVSQEQFDELLLRLFKRILL